MYKAMYIDETNREPDELAGYFDSDWSLVEAFRTLTDRNSNYSYVGMEQYGEKHCHILEYKNNIGRVTKTRYYLVKIENGWV